jgi:hypothetical protein
MKATDCKRFDSCSAPICPLNQCSGTWVADEEICRSSSFSSEGWLQNQKKIAKRTRDFETYYTYTMLQRNFIIGKGITGLDPDHDISELEQDETRWLNFHPEKHIINEEKREQLKKRMAEVSKHKFPKTIHE